MWCVREVTCVNDGISARILTLTLVLLVLFVQIRARDCVGKLTVEEGKGGGMLDKREGMCEERCGHSTWSIINWIFPFSSRALHHRHTHSEYRLIVTRLSKPLANMLY